MVEKKNIDNTDITHVTSVYHHDTVTTQSRIAVLEQIASSHEDRISDIEDFHRAVVERFDQKIQLDAANQVIMERTLSKAVVSIDGLAESLRGTISTATDASKLAAKHEAMGQAIIKVGGFLAFLVAAVWTLGTYFHII